jgi:hypothetical protein
MGEWERFLDNVRHIMWMAKKGIDVSCYWNTLVKHHPIQEAVDVVCGKVA